MQRNAVSSSFDRTARLVFIFSLVLLLLSAAQIIYRYTLPTDGWSVYTTEIEPADWVYDINLVGAPSGLRQADILQSVDGHSVQGIATTDYVEPLSNWQVGDSVVMQVIRGEESLDVLAPVVHWTGAALWRFNVGSLANAVDTFGMVLFLALGWFTFLRRPNVPSAQALLILSSAVGAVFISGLLPDGLSVQFNRAAFIMTVFFSYSIFGILLAPALMAFTLLFPQPKRAIKRQPQLALLPAALGIAMLIGVFVLNIAVIGWFGTLAMIVASIISLIHSSLTQRDAISQAQLRWAIGGLVAGLGLLLLNFPPAFGLVTDPILVNLLDVAASLSFAVIGVCLSIAVLRYRLFDIDVIIRKTLVYTVLTASLAIVYLGIIILFEGLFEAMSGEQSPISIVLSTLIIAALFSPMRRRVQTVIDRRFFRKKYNAQQVMADFAQISRNMTDLEAISAEVVHVVQETLQPESVTIWLRR
jgi:hypothetical protein